MSSIKAKDTKPELLFRKLLWKNGLRGYRKHYKIEGRPDIVFTKNKVAIFIHGCYWHRCPHCNLTIPKSNTSFWENKFMRNVERDKLKKEQLVKKGWNVLTFWECEIKSIPATLVERTRVFLNR